MAKPHYVWGMPETTIPPCPALIRFGPRAALAEFGALMSHPAKGFRP